MRQSQLFTKTRKEAPKDEKSSNAQLLIRAGFIHKEMAGVYTLLPLGVRVMENIARIIREEMNAIGGQEMFLTVLQEKKLWEKTDRWSDDVVDNWFKTELKNGTELGLGFTHEEPLTALMKNHISSYKDLPVYAYQIQTKLRNELRAKSGIMRAREFMMKDLYSFNRSEEDLDAFYESAKKAYANVYNRCGIGDVTFLTFASGGTFSKYSHEYQTISDAGEDIIYLDREKGLAVNKEVLSDDVLGDLGLSRKKLEKVKAIEVGNIFKQKEKFSEPLSLTFVDEDGKEKPVIMGAYGIGLGRLMGTIVEVLHDSAGIIWPEEVTPYDVHLVSLIEAKDADGVYEKLKEKGISVLYDDRQAVRAGQKFADADLIGIPKRIVVSDKTLKEKSVEVKMRSEKDAQLVKITQL